MVAIREADQSDEPQIAALWTEAYCGPGAGQRRQPYTVGDVEEARRYGTVYVARDEQVVGVVVYYPPSTSSREVPSAGEAELTRLAVAASNRGRGIGRTLVQQCLQRAKENRAEALVLWSRPHQEEAHRLYLSLGFTHTLSRDGTDSTGERWVFIHPLRTCNELG